MREAKKIVTGNIEIIYLDFSGLRDASEIKKQIAHFGAYIVSQPYNSLNTLTNLEGMHFNTDIYNAFADYVKKNNPYVSNSAIIGMKGLMQIFYKGFVKITGRNVDICDSYDEAVKKLENSNKFAEVL